MTQQSNVTQTDQTVPPATLLVALKENGSYDFSWIGTHRRWFADDATLSGNGTRLVEFVPGRIVAPPEFAEAVSQATEGDVAFYSMRTGEDGEYELLRRGLYVGEILFYPDAQIVLEALQHAGMAKTASQRRLGEFALRPYCTYMASVGGDGKYVLYRDGQVIGRHLHEVDAKNVVAALADTHGAEAVICVPGERVATVGGNNQVADRDIADDTEEEAYMERLAQEDYVAMWRRTPEHDRPETHKTSPVGAVLAYLRSLENTLMDAPFTREELGVAIAALEQVGLPSAVKTDGDTHA